MTKNPTPLSMAASWNGGPSQPKEKKDSKMFKLLQNVKDGLSTTDIIDETPSFGFRSRDIDVLHQTYFSEKFKREYRQIEVCCVFGATGTGKTRDIYPSA